MHVAFRWLFMRRTFNIQFNRCDCFLSDFRKPRAVRCAATSFRLRTSDAGPAVVERLPSRCISQRSSFMWFSVLLAASTSCSNVRRRFDGATCSVWKFRIPVALLVNRHGSNRRLLFLGQLTRSSIVRVRRPYGLEDSTELCLCLCYPDRTFERVMRSVLHEKNRFRKQSHTDPNDCFPVCDVERLETARCASEN